jgi:lipopolysaccharide/colanic/teichoic acid biosynthesis glycosyltransferase
MNILYYVFISILFLGSLFLQGLCALAVLIASGRPILFRQKRVGKDGIPFTIYKFRTMRIGAEKEQKKLRKRNEAGGPVFKIRNDPRFTAVGKFLSHTGLDELPQIWNVLKGDMALIGPRPLPVSEALKLTKKQQERHQVKPGIISPWILDGYHTKSFISWMKSDIAYVKSKTIVSDIVIFFRAIGFLIQLFVKSLWECGSRKKIPK